MKIEIERRVLGRNNESEHCYYYVRVVGPGSTCLPSIVSFFELAAWLKDSARQWIELFDSSQFSFPFTACILFPPTSQSNLFHFNVLIIILMISMWPKIEYVTICRTKSGICLNEERIIISLENYFSKISFEDSPPSTSTLTAIYIVTEYFMSKFLIVGTYFT